MHSRAEADLGFWSVMLGNDQLLSGFPELHEPLITPMSRIRSSSLLCRGGVAKLVTVHFFDRG